MASEMHMNGDGGFLDLGFARLDTDRRRRTGFPEVVFCQGKEDSFLREIFTRLHEQNGKRLRHNR